jgi:hypothetical protein
MPPIITGRLTAAPLGKPCSGRFRTVRGGEGGRGGAELVHAAGEELRQERLRVAERARSRFGGLADPRLLQHVGGEEYGVVVVVPHGVVSFQHGDQQRGAGRLDGEQDAEATVGGRARPELQQPLGRCLAQLFLDLAGDLLQPGRRAAGGSLPRSSASQS